LFKIKQARHKQVPSHSEVATEWTSTWAITYASNNCTTSSFYC